MFIHNKPRKTAQYRYRKKMCVEADENYEKSSEARLDIFECLEVPTEISLLIAN